MFRLGVFTHNIALSLLHILVYIRFSHSGDDEESGHFNGKQIDTPPCLLSFTALSTLHKIIHPILRRLAKIHSESDLPKATAS